MKFTQEKVINDLKELFDVENPENNSLFNDNTFMIDKNHKNRIEVMENLENYFGSGVIIEDGYLSVDPITFVFTTFKVCSGKPE